MTVAALFVQKDGCYFGLDDVEPWDEERDARKYPGPHPVVAHPPCERWGRYWFGGPSALVRREKGDDGGCFASALDSVRRWGGILEHPAHSDAWIAFHLPKPDRHGGWLRTPCGGWTCHVEQGQYGHPARKATWLYAYGVKIPRLRWGVGKASKALVSNCGNHTPRTADRPRVTKAQASRTPDEFRDVLLEIARSARSREVGSA